MSKIDLTSMKLFLAIIEEGSITKAAAREHIVSSAVSRRLGELEDLFGVALVERSRTGVSPTPAGEALTHHARMVQQSVDRLHDEMTDFLKGVRGHVRVRVSSSALSVGLPAHLMAFMQAHERIRLDLQELQTPKVFREIAEGRADIGIAPNIVPSEGLELLPYHPYDLAVALPAKHPLVGRKTLRYDDVLRYDQVELESQSALAALLDTAAKQGARSKRTNVRVHSFEDVCQMVSMGMGVGVVPSLFQKSRVKAHNLKFVPLADGWAHSMICVITRRHPELPPPARDLVEHLRESAGPLQGLRQN